VFQRRNRPTAVDHCPFIEWDAGAIVSDGNRYFAASTVVYDPNLNCGLGCGVFEGVFN